MMKSIVLTLAILFVLFLPLAPHAEGQELPIGDWQSHLAYERTQDIEEVDGEIFCATSNGLFSYNPKDNSIEVHTPVQGYHGVEVEALGYSKEHELLFIGYRDAVIDMVSERSITHIRDIARKEGGGLRNINNFYFYGDYCYIATGFGITVYNLKKNEFKETYEHIWSQKLGPDSVRVEAVEVFDLTVLNDTLYAATQKGLLQGPIHRNLQYYANWETVSTGHATKVVDFQERLYVVMEGKLRIYDGSQWLPFAPVGDNVVTTVTVNHDQLVVTEEERVVVVSPEGEVTTFPVNHPIEAILSEDGNIWMGVSVYRLAGRIDDELLLVAPNGPRSPMAWGFAQEEETLWVAGGSVLRGKPQYSTAGFYAYQDGRWENWSGAELPGIDTTPVLDIIDVAVHPTTGTKYMASFGIGLVEFTEEDGAKLYNHTNSILQNALDQKIIQVSSVEFDADGNLWMGNYNTSKPLVVKTTDGWANFNIGSHRNIQGLVTDLEGNIWGIDATGGMFVYDPAGTPLDARDDRYRSLSTQTNFGSLPASEVTALATDLDGEIWVGTTNGIAVFYEPELTLTGEGASGDAQQIYVTGEGEASYLLTGETVTAIAVDGGNRKWLGTSNGVWLTDEDGNKIIHHFTTDNSPLFSNNIQAIGVNHNTGEVFFSTDKGMISYNAGATDGEEVFDEIYAYPNPVRPEYAGPIAIRGLVHNSVVKITDASGNLVSEIRSAGGTAVWDGRNINGTLVTSGVYMVFVADETGQDAAVTKILVVR